MSTNLFRMLRVGDTLSFDQGRVKLSLKDKSGRTARPRATLQEAVVIDKPHPVSNVEAQPARAEGASGSEN